MKFPVCSLLLFLSLLTVHISNVGGENGILDKCTKPKCRLDGGKAKMVFQVESNCSTTAMEKHVDEKLEAVDKKLEAVDEKLEELKLLLEKHTARTDELSCCCENDTSSMAPTTSPTTAPTTTPTTTPTSTASTITTPLTATPTTSPTTTTKITTTEFLYISDSQIYELPSFRLTTSCPVPPHPIPGLSAAVAGLSDGSLVICGGLDYTTYRGHSSCHTLFDNGWVKTNSLQDPAYYAAASKTTDGLVVTGGLRDNSQGQGDYLSTTQTLSGGRWTSGPQISVKMGGHCQVTVRSSVIIAGGYNGDDREQSADAYILEGGRWSKLQSMKTPRGEHACAVYLGEVYAIGGYNFDKGSFFTQVEIFNVTSNTWRDGPQLPDISYKYNSQAVVTSDALYYIANDGKVVKLVNDGSRWENVTTIASNKVGGRSVFPAPVVTRHNLKC